MLTVPGSRRASSRTSPVAVSYRCSTVAQRRHEPATRVPTSGRSGRDHGTWLGRRRRPISVAFRPYGDPGQAVARRHRGRSDPAVGVGRHLPLRPYPRPASRSSPIDTPPPTVSGSLHVGHVFSYTHTDCIARFQRMGGKQVFYPIGWDDNGLATERRVQNFYGVRCDSTLRVRPRRSPRPRSPTEEPGAGQPAELHRALQAAAWPTTRSRSRRCSAGSGSRSTGRYLYKTIDDHCIRTSQQAFLHNLARGEAYSIDAPDALGRRLQDRRRPGRARGPRDARATTTSSPSTAPTAAATSSIDTTRPELIPSCVALVAHPDDERYQPLFGTVTVTDAAVRGRGAGPRPSSRRPREGHRRSP